jgi:hypothetical protein
MVAALEHKYGFVLDVEKDSLRSGGITRESFLLESAHIAD